MTLTHLTRVLLAVAIVAVAAGTVIAIVSASHPISFGWVAYAPLSGKVFNPNSAHVVATTTVLGLATAAAGLILGAFWAGLKVGRRGHQQR
jgi:heme/copper-type cytochrome/quinol oxidase subunit 1